MRYSPGAPIAKTCRFDVTPFNLPFLSVTNFVILCCHGAGGYFLVLIFAARRSHRNGVKPGAAPR
jgi:hypothetical protein